MLEQRLYRAAGSRSLLINLLRTPGRRDGSSRKGYSETAAWGKLLKDLQRPELIRWPRALIVRSSFDNPYVNLAIEKYLLDDSDLKSRIYFFYVNRPCVVIGRNQNPWLEVNLQKLRENKEEEEKKSSFPVDLVRRRSGGGTVFHDYGNLNYCAIMPIRFFKRDLHAQALADGLNEAAIDRVEGHFLVNDRHDVVLQAQNSPIQLKVSGSAYKLTKSRALHHGTCLVASPNLSQISQYLRSPAKPFTSAKGVESVSSKIGNVSSLSFDSLQESNMLDVVMDEVASSLVSSSMCSSFGPNMHENQRYHWINSPEIVKSERDRGLREVIDKILANAAELENQDWKYLQTPRFTFASHPEPTRNAKDRTSSSSSSSSEKLSATAALPNDFPQDERVRLDVKSGVIQDCEINCLRPDVSLNGRVLHQIEDWRELVTNDVVGSWLNKTLLVPSK